jgi:hypothetical protein
LVEAPGETDGEPAERFGRPGRIAFWLTCFAALGGLLQFALITLPMPGGRGLAGEIIFAAMLISSISVSGIVVLFGLLGFVIWRDYYLRAGTLRSPGAPRTAAHHGAPRAAFGQRRR